MAHHTNFCHPQHRELLASLVKYSPGARAAVRHMYRLGATNLRPDYMLFRTEGGSYDRAIDPTAWNAEVRGSIFVCMIRRQHNNEVEWTLHS